jgi:electron transport complex protein RnfG
MAKLESSLKNMILSLLLICAGMSLALGYVYNITKGPIETAQKQKVTGAISAVVPAFDNDALSEMDTLNGVDIYPARKGGELVGMAIKTFTNNGFTGYFSLMVGFKPDGSIHNISVMEQNETPGLGTKMKEPGFKDQFKGKIPGVWKMKVKKDGGEVDAITASTITSRAFCDAVQRGSDAFAAKMKAMSATNNSPDSTGKTN